MSRVTRSVGPAPLLRARTLEATGVARAVFSTPQGCTGAGAYHSLNLSVFFSYRRARATGRMAGCIRLCERAQRE